MHSYSFQHIIYANKRLSKRVSNPNYAVIIKYKHSSEVIHEFIIHLNPMLILANYSYFDWSQYLISTILGLFIVVLHRLNPRAMKLFSNFHKYIQLFL